MRDEMDGRIWSEAHERFSHDFALFLGRIGAGFVRLNRIQWAAPWPRPDRPPSVRGPAQA
jgi:hypothetical protein